MPEPIRICIFDAANATEPPFQRPFLDLTRVQILGQSSTWEEIREWIQHGGVDIVAVNLDDPSSPDDPGGLDDPGDNPGGEGIKVVERIAQIAPSIGIVGVSSQTDPHFIISAMRRGCGQFVTKPVEADDLRQAVERLHVSHRSTPVDAKRVCVIGSSGGVGATTVACNLAIEFGHLTDRRTALVDMNLEFGDVCCSFDFTPKYSIADVCGHDVQPDTMMIENAMHDLPCNVSVLGRPERIEDARLVAPEGIQSMLGLLGDMYPYTVLDLPRIFSFMSAAAVENADRILIVTQLSVPCIRNATRIYQCLQEMNADDSRIEIVLNRCNASFEKISPDEVATHFNRPVFAMIPNDYRRVQTSLDLGSPVMTDTSNSPARLAIQEMARKISGMTSSENTATASSGIFGRIWRKPAKAGA